MSKGSIIRWARLLVLLLSYQVTKIRGSDLGSSADGAATSNEGLGVVVLTSANFERHVGDGSVWLIEFYAPW
jgi:hypothetical protein